MYRSKGSNRVNEKLNKIENEINNGHNLKKNLEILKSLDFPNFRLRIKNDIGTVYINMGDFDKALEIFIQLMEEDPSYHSAYKITKLLLSIGDVDRARYFVDKIKDDDVKEYFEGFVNKEIGNYDEAIKSFSKLRFTLMEYRGLLQMGHCYYLMHDYKSAKKAYEKIGSNTDEKSEAIVSLMEIALEEKDDNIVKLIDVFDGKTSRLNRVMKKFRRAYSYYLFQNHKLDSKYKKYYYESQLFNYDKKKVIDHISARHIDKDDYRFQFIADLDINEVYDYCANNLVNRLNGGSSDSYIVDYPSDIGFLNDKTTNRLYISTIPNTKKILTIYPIVNYDRILKRNNYKDGNSL